jgi:hypothetical protein
MTRHFALARAVLIKDVLLLWPLALLSIATILTRYLLKTEFDLIQMLLPLMAALVPTVFLLGLVHQDAPASLRHDWLTRPVGTRHLLIAKTVLAVLVVVVPSVLGPVLAALRDGAPASEALLSAIAGEKIQITVGVALLLIAALTTTLLEAAGMALAFFLLVAVVPPFLLPISGLSEGVMVLGSAWAVISAFLIVAVVGAAAVLWLQYAERRTTAARGAFAVMLVAFGVLMMTFGWNVVYALQSLITPATAPPGFAIASVRDCFETEAVDPLLQGTTTPPDTPWDRDTRKKAGANAIGFWTAIRSQGLPQGWRMFPGYRRGNFLDTQGKTISTIEPTRFTTSWKAAPGGGLEARNPWLLTRARFDELKEHAQAFKLDYELTLIAPVHGGEIPVDGARHEVEGLGTCKASAEAPGAVRVSCFKSGSQAEMLTALPAGASPEQETRFDAPDFGPAFLRNSIGLTRELRLRVATSPARIRLTAYEARAHLTRSITVAGMPGKTANACPAEPKAVPAGAGAAEIDPAI